MAIDAPRKRTAGVVHAVFAFYTQYNHSMAFLEGNKTFQKYRAIVVLAVVVQVAAVVVVVKQGKCVLADCVTCTKIYDNGLSYVL